MNLQLTTINHLKKIRHSIALHAPADDPHWTAKCIEASDAVVNDIALWYNTIAPERGIDLTVNPFDASLLRTGWHFNTNQVNITINENEKIFLIDPLVVVGGSLNHVYKYIGIEPLLITDYALIDFTSGDWIDITSQLYTELYDLASYKALYLIYRFLVGDSVEVDAFSVQRDYYEKLYGTAWKTLLANGITYDYDYDLSDYIPSVQRVTKVVW